MWGEQIKRFFPSIVTNIDFLKLWLAQITSQIGLNALYFILALKVYEQTQGSNTAVSLLILAFTVPSVFFGYLAGVLVDHQDLKKVLIYTNLFRALVVFGLLFVYTNIFFIYGLVLLLALVTLFFLPAEGSALPALVKEKKDLISANSLFTLTLQGALIIGFVAAGPLLSLLGETTTLIVLVAFFLIALACVWFLPDSIRSIEEKEGVSSWRSFLDGIIFFFKTRSVRDAIFFLTSTQAITLVLATIAPGFVDRVLDLDVRLTSLVLVAPAAVGMIVGSVFLSHRAGKHKEAVLVTWGLFVAGISFSALSVLERVKLSNFIFLLAILFIVLLGVAASLITIPATTELQHDTPERFRGRAYGILGTFVSGVSALPVILAGAIGDTFGVRSVMIAMAIVTIAAGVYRLRGKSYTEG
ncbi:MAG: MFS transporter [bacterium]|nr:MFS transporter [bacterium]